MLEKLSQNPLPFFHSSAKSDDTVVYSGITLTRNLSNTPFPAGAAEDVCIRVRHAVKEALLLSGAFGDDALLLDREKLSDTEGLLLSGRRWLNKNFFTQGHAKALFIRADEKCALTVNDQDHLNLQTLRPGLHLQDMRQIIDETDNRLNEHLEYAFDDNFGFLTSDITAAGTGMRVTAALHLPALFLTGGVENDIRGLKELQFDVRSFNGGKIKSSPLYLISNKYTAGGSEESIIERTNAVIKQLTGEEKLVRKELLKKNAAAILDYAGRAYGKLRYSYRISAEEAIDAVFRLQFGTVLGIFRTVDHRRINILMQKISESNIRRESGEDISETEAEIHRAAICRQVLG